MANKETGSSFLEKISGKYLYGGLLLALFITLMIFYKPMSIDRMEPKGGDVIKSLGQSHQMIDYQEKTGERALWNPNVFTGIPTYFKLRNESLNIDRIISQLNRWFLDWRVSWFLVGAIGMYLLLSALNFPWYISIVGVIAFVFWPHFQGLVEVGHNAKVRAICAMPLVIFGFLNYVKKRDLISIIWFTLFFSLQFRTQHYQVIFYTLLVLLGMGIYYIVTWSREREFVRLGKTITIFVAGMVVAVLMSAQPLFVAKEYTPYSTRGGNAIELNEQPAEKAAKKSGGVTFEYATSWSFAPKEMMNLISPRFFGGVSSEVYKGNKYPRLKNQTIPGYWGDMPFTQSSEYIGIIIVVLAIFGFWMNRKNGLVITFSVLFLFSLLLSFGSHFPILYKPFFYYLPYFDKFRAPVMTIILVAFNVFILAMYGLKSLTEIDSKEKFKTFAIIAGAFAVLGFFFVLLPNSLSYTAAGDARYASNPQILEIIKGIRKEFMMADTLRMLVFLGLFIALVTLFFMKKIKKELMLVGVFALVAIDSISVSYRFIENASFFNKKSAERQYFRKNQFDQIIDQDKDYSRVIELGKGFTSNDMAYHHQLIGGYSAIKPQLIQDIVDNNLYKSHDPKIPVNLNVISMLNGKYIVAGGQLQHPDVQLLSVNQQQRKMLYLNKKALPRAFFVEKIKKLSDEKAVVKYMNSGEFAPDSIAIFSTDELEARTYSREGNITISEYTPNEIKLDVENEGTAFLILSEAYFPIGWKCTINGKETEIHQMNHILRGVEVPAGNNEVLFTFAPQSYKTAAMISGFTTSLAWLALLVLYILKNKDKIASLKNRKSK